MCFLILNLTTSPSPTYNVKNYVLQPTKLVLSAVTLCQVVMPKRQVRVMWPQGSLWDREGEQQWHDDIWHTRCLYLAGQRSENHSIRVLDPGGIFFLREQSVGMTELAISTSTEHVEKMPYFSALLNISLWPSALAAGYYFPAGFPTWGREHLLFPWQLTGNTYSPHHNGEHPHLTQTCHGFIFLA